MVIYKIFDLLFELNKIPEHQDFISEVLSNYNEKIDSDKPIKNAELIIQLSTEQIPKSKIYRLTATEREVMDEILGTLETKGIIKNSDSLYSSPCFLRPKSDGKYNLIVDYSDLNNIMVPLNEYFPDIVEVFHKFTQAKYFTKLDLTQGFNQVKINNNDQHKTAFATHRGKFEFTRLPFGLKNSPKYFQKILTRLLYKNKNVFVFVDDIIIYDTDLEQHKKSLHSIFTVLKDNIVIKNTRINQNFAQNK